METRHSTGQVRTKLKETKARGPYFIPIPISSYIHIFNVQGF